MYALLKKVIVSFTLLLSLFTLTSCSTLPEGAQTPHLTMHAISLLNENADKEPAFLIEYSLEHASLSPLTSKEIKAEISVRSEPTARLDQEFKMIFEPRADKHYVLEVPVNLQGSASLDSLRHSSLLMLDAQAKLSIIFTDDEDLQNFNPSASFTDIVKVSH